MPFIGSGNSPPAVPTDVFVTTFLDRLLSVDDTAYTFEVRRMLFHILHVSAIRAGWRAAGLICTLMVLTWSSCRSLLLLSSLIHQTGGRLDRSGQWLEVFLLANA
jgi:hypothetical protein